MIEAAGFLQKPFCLIFTFFFIKSVGVLFKLIT